MSDLSSAIHKLTGLPEIKVVPTPKNLTSITDEIDKLLSTVTPEQKQATLMLLINHVISWFMSKHT